MAAAAVLEVAYKGSRWSDGSLGAGDGGGALEMDWLPNPWALCKMKMWVPGSKMMKTLKRAMTELHVKLATLVIMNCDPILTPPGTQVQQRIHGGSQGSPECRNGEAGNPPS